MTALPASSVAAVTATARSPAKSFAHAAAATAAVVGTSLLLLSVLAAAAVDSAKAAIDHRCAAIKALP